MLEQILKDYGAEEVDALTAYSDIFRLGEHLIQSENGGKRDMIANPLGYYRMKDKKKGKYRVLFEDSFADVLKELQAADDFAIVNGITYFGRRNLQAHASKMFAMIFDLDGVTDTTLNNFLYAAFSESRIYPIPNYIALSGHGVHLYYLFEQPVSLYPYTKIQLKSLKYALTEKLWNPYTSTNKNRQYQGINQGFRVIGGATKIPGVKVRAFKLNTHYFTLSELSEYVPEEARVDEAKLFKESKITLEQAKELYPEWYQKRVVEGNRQKGHWICKRDLYEWWKRQIKEGAAYGHRYFCLMCLAIYGVKSGVPFSEVKKDALSLVPFMNDLSPENEFTKADCKAALEAFDERYVTFPVDDISKLTDITIQKNRRNGRKQRVHLRLARSALDILSEEAGHPLQGRPDKQKVVKEWQRKNEGRRKADCIRETGLSKATVYKYWE